MNCHSIIILITTLTNLVGDPNYYSYNRKARTSPLKTFKVKLNTKLWLINKIVLASKRNSFL
jgi:hypothetical protein